MSPNLWGASPIDGTTPTVDDSAESAAVSFELVNGLIIVKAQVQGQQGNYVLDTGAPTSLINKKIENGQFELWSPRGIYESEEIQINDIRLGAIKKSQMLGWAMDMSALEEQVNVPLAGILGNDFWENRRIIINYADQTIVFHESGLKEEICSEQFHIASLTLEDHAQDLHIVELEIDGQQRRMAFDTGAGVNVLDQGLSANDVTTTLTKLGQIEVKNLSYVNLDLSELNQSTDDAEVHGILSASALDAEFVIIDYKVNRIHICWRRSNS